jgi:hypothetical protein
MPTRTTPNPLDAYLTSRPSNFARDFKLPPMPSLRDSLRGNNVLDAAAAHDQAVEQWRINAEQSISERLRQLETTTTTVTTAATQVVTPPTPSTPSTPVLAPVTSVNGKIGDVILDTDDILEGIVNFYLTAARWLEMFDTLGFHQNDIPIAEVVTIPADRNLVMYGPLTVEGTLVISGHFVNLTV